MHQITIQHAVKNIDIPTATQLKRWAKQVLKLNKKMAELNIRIVDKIEMKQLNTQYRHKSSTTNVLSFPFDTPKEIEDEIPFLGDIVICAEVVNQEALQQNKSREAHWAHIVIHGTLHLLGYDHETDADAAMMEPKEITILQSLGFSNPYQ